MRIPKEPGNEGALYKPSELRRFLDELGISPKKGLSQNFLIDGNIIRKIISVSGVQEEDTILEIGPGPGSLTQALLETGATLVAVEKDRVLARALERLRKNPHQLHIFCDDILSFPIQTELQGFLRAGKKAKVIANLPYHLTTPILAQLIPMSKLFSSITVMVQEEVARRMTAQAGTADYGSLSLFLQFYTSPRYAFGVSRNCFYPIPKVDSAMVVLELREPPLATEETSFFFQLTRRAFAQRRKMLRSSLREIFPSHVIEQALTAIGESPTARPETLSLEKFLELRTQLLSFL